MFARVSTFAFIVITLTVTARRVASVATPIGSIAALLVADAELVKLVSLSAATRIDRVAAGFTAAATTAAVAIATTSRGFSGKTLAIQVSFVQLLSHRASESPHLLLGVEVSKLAATVDCFAKSRNEIKRCALAALRTSGRAIDKMPKRLCFFGELTHPIGLAKLSRLCRRSFGDNGAPLGGRSFEILLGSKQTLDGAFSQGSWKRFAKSADRLIDRKIGDQSRSCR